MVVSKNMPNFASANRHTGSYQSGQMGQTVNLLVYTFGGSNPSSPTKPRQNTDRGFILKSGVFVQVESNEIHLHCRGAAEKPEISKKLRK